MPYGPISPYFDFDSCIKYLPSISYQYSIEKFHKAMKKAEFISEAGEDSYYLWYSDLVMDSIIDRYGEVDSITAVIRNNFSEINQLFRCLAGGGTFYGHMEKRLEGYVAHYLWHGFQSNFLTEKSKVNINDSIKKMVLNNPDVWSVKLLDECFDDLKITISDPWLTKITLEYLKVYSHE